MRSEDVLDHFDLRTPGDEADMARWFGTASVHPAAGAAGPAPPAGGHVLSCALFWKNILSGDTDGLLDRVERWNAAATPALVAFTEYGYDALNRLQTTTDSRTAAAGTGATTTAYLSATSDFVKSVTDPGSRTTLFTYDHRGRRLVVDAPNTVATAPNGTTSTLLNVAVTSYFPDGSVKEVDGDQTYRTAHTYDYAGRMKTMTTYGTQTAVTTWSYSGTTGHLLDKIYQGGKATSYTYTDAGRLQTRAWARKVDPGDSGSPRVTTTYAYVNGLLDTVTYNDGVTRDIEYTYNRLGQVEAVLQGANTAGGNDNLHEFEYDSSDFRLLHETITYGDGADLATNPHLRRRLFHTADAARRSTGFELAAPGTGGSWLAPEHANLYSYDTAGRFARVKDDQDRYHTYLYTADSENLVRWIYRGHGLTGGGGITDNRMLTFIAYETTRDLMAEQRNIVMKTAHEVVSSYIYTANAIGQRTAVSTTTNAGTAYADGSYNWDWGYNSKGEVVKADHTGSGNTANDRFYAFDGIGNRLETRTGTFTTTGGIATDWTPNALNQYQTIDPGTSVSPVHDDDGNLTKDKGENLRGVALEYTWDAENRIVAVRRASDDALVAEYEYDFQSRRIRKQTTAAAPQGAEETTFIYHGWNMIAEYTDLDSVPTLHKAYSWGLDLSRSLQGAGGVGGLLAITDHRTATAGHYYPAFDGNGNLMQLYKDVGGTDLVERVARFDYDPFGRIVREDGAYAPHLRIRFSTKYQDQETGFLYYGYRYYDPVTGRWPSRDPIEEEGGLNLYGFIGNNGINKSDYLGLIGPGSGPSRHHWFPQFTDSSGKREGEKIFKDICGEDFNIDHYTTLMSGGAHAIIENTGKYNEEVKDFLKTNPNCCVLLLFIKDLMQLSVGIMMDLDMWGKLDFSTGEVMPELRNFKPRGEGSQTGPNNNRDFENLINSKCGDGDGSRRRGPCGQRDSYARRLQEWTAMPKVRHAPQGGPGPDSSPNSGPERDNDAVRRSPEYHRWWELQRRRLSDLTERERAEKELLERRLRRIGPGTTIVPRPTPGGGFPGGQRRPRVSR